MLCQLTIENIALIDHLTLDFTSGFCALTGETGAGKSIVVDAMNLAIGERADRELIRSGEEKARVEALFEMSGSVRLYDLLKEMGIEADDGQIIISRELSASGRNICRVNGQLLPLSSLKKLTAAMVDLHGQHEHQSLLDEARHIGFLDAFGDDTHSLALAEVQKSYDGWAQAAKRLRALSGDTRQRAQRVDMLSFQMREIDAMQLRIGEEKALASRREKLRNTVKIRAALFDALSMTAGGEEGDEVSGAGVADALARAAESVRQIEGYSEQYQELAKTLSEVAFAAQDAVAELEAQCYALEEDNKSESLLDRIEKRLDDIEQLKRKYGEDIAGILAYRDSVEQQLSDLNSSEERARKLEKRIAALENLLTSANANLTAHRNRTARLYEEQVCRHLFDLGMERAQFSIEIDASQQGVYSPNGVDRVRFLFSANAGEPVRPLSRIASGGEMSRVMLALKNVAAEYGDVGCLIFDEIDTGISGRMAQVVGEKIARIARGRQVICVTHLPQIACMADTHYLVQKDEDQENRARTNVLRLDETARAKEISRLIGGAGSTGGTGSASSAGDAGETDTAIQHARAMLTAAEDVKAALG